MKKHFYHHIVETDSLITELNELDLVEEERKELATLIHSSLHHAVLDAILSELSEEDKRRFLKHLVSDDHEKLWMLLNEKIEGVEEKIKKAAHALKEQLSKDIKEAK